VIAATATAQEVRRAVPVLRLIARWFVIQPNVINALQRTVQRD
jgi:hypothetical protein